MQVSSLLEKIGGTKTHAPEKFIALTISPETVHSAIYLLDDNQAKIVNYGSLEDHDGSEDKLVQAADASLATALENISPEPDKVILGLPINWVKGEKIATSKQPLLKAITEKLSLKPIGFVVVSEAIINFLKVKEGTPPTAIFIKLTETEARINLVKTGKVTGHHTVGRSDDLGSDVEEGLARFKPTEPLPSRMIIYDGHLDLESARQVLLSYSWQDKLPFLHVPKIEILDKDIPIRAVSIAAITEATSTSPQPVVAPEKKPDLKAHGFYQDQDVLHNQPDSKPQPQKHSPSKENLPVPQPPPPPQPRSSQPQERVPADSAIPTPESPSSANQLLSALSKKLSSLSSIFSRRRFTKTSLIYAGGSLLVLFSLIIAYFTIPKAQVTLYLHPKVIEDKVKFTVASGKSTDLEKERLSGQIIDIEVEGELEKDTTGESLVGDKATGEVIVYNKTNNLKKFSSGTTLIGPSSLQFTLNSDISIASQSATDTGITFGTTTTSVTATEVGTESNLSKDTTFTIKGFDSTSYSAKASTNFEGGSSKQVLTVAQDDQDELLDELTDQLKNQALEELAVQIQTDETIIDSDYDQEIIDQKYTHAIGEEADTLGLSLKLKLSTLAFKTQDLLLLAQKDISDQPTEGFITLEDASQIDITKAWVADGEADVVAKLKTKLVPQFDPQEIVTNLVGKYPETTESYLKSLPSFSKVDIELSPKLPRPLATFPRLTQNIHLNIKLDETK